MIVLLAFFSNGCFPMGLPEYFSEVEKLSGTTQGSLSRLSLQSPHVLVIAPRSVFLVPGDVSPQSIGNQFLFGIIPLTRLSLEHSGEVLLSEVLVDELQRRGFTVFETTEEYAHFALAALSPEITIRAKLTELRLNAFDAFLFRVNSARGLLTLEAFNQYETGRGRRIVRKLEKDVVKSHGRAATLFTLLLRGTQEALSSALTEVLAAPPLRKYHRMAGVPSSAEVTLIFPPELTDHTTPDLGSALRASYGFGPEPRFTEKMIRRLLQRGMMAAFLKRGIPVATSSRSPFQMLSPARGAHQPFWKLLSRLSVHAPGSGDEPLVLDGELQLFKTTPARTGWFFCSVREPLLEGRDGSLVLTLERASESLVEGYLSGEHDSPNSGCRYERDVSNEHDAPR